MIQYLLIQMQRTAIGCMNCRQPTRTRMYVYIRDKTLWSHFCFTCSKTATGFAEIANWERVSEPPPYRGRVPPMLGAIMALANSGPYR